MRERSFWAWGFEDRFPTDERRTELAQQIGMLFPEHRVELAPVPTAAALKLNPPRVDVPRLEAPISQDERTRALHSYGRAYRDVVRGFYNDFSAAPDVVATPRNEREISELFEWASRARVAVIPFGGGTSVVGGVEAARPAGFNGVVSVDLRALDRVLEVDPVSRAARIQAGATGPELDAQLSGHGFSLRHFPQSYEFSTLGGWIVTRAGGHFATLYTHIDDLVESTRMVTPSGDVWESRRLPASGAGPSPDRWILGSEGILGIVTEAWVRVQAKPRFRASANVHFEQFDPAVDAVRAIAQSGLYPSNCRLLDAQEAFLNRVAFDGSTVVLLGFESADHPLEAWMGRAIALARSFGGTLPEPAKYASEKESAEGAAAAWRSAFLEAPYLQSALITLGILVDTFETACTWDKFRSLHAAVKEDVEAALRRVCGAGVVSCRFSHVYPDGPAPYFTFVGPARRGTELEQWGEIKQAASDALMKHGATITHHHAVGRTHRPWYDRERPEAFARVLRATKKELDPTGILNPGVLI